MPMLGTRGAGSAMGFGFAGIVPASGSINSIGIGWNAGSGTFTYSTVNATSATINGVSVPTGLNQPYTVSAPGEGSSANYTLIVQPGGAQYTGTISQAARNPPYLIQFQATSANGTQINMGESMTVSWSVGNSSKTEIYYPGIAGNIWNEVSDNGSVTLTPNFDTPTPYVSLRATAPDGSTANFGSVVAQTAYVRVNGGISNAALNVPYTFTPVFNFASSASFDLVAYGFGTGSVYGATSALTRKFQGGGAISGGQYALFATGVGYRGVSLSWSTQYTVANGWTGNIIT